MPKLNQLNMAFVGCGGIAKAHWRGIQTFADRINVTAAVDIDRERAGAMAEQTGAEPFSSLEAALDQGDFDAVDIMRPHNQHKQAAELAFAAGKHVLLEKPMATTPTGCERILAAARRAKTVFMVAEQSQYWPDALAVQKLIQDGVIGDVITARAYYVDAERSGLGPASWRYDVDITGGGICIDGGSHWIRPLRMWLGEIDEVVAVVGHPSRVLQGESLARALLRFSSGKVAVFDALQAGSFMGPGEEFRVTGMDGELVIEKGNEGRLLHYSKRQPDGRVIVSKNPGRSDSFGCELGDFADAVLDGKSLAVDAEYSVGELRTALAIYRSVESRQWEKVWDQKIGPR